jgi:hypothetical protein
MAIDPATTTTVKVGELASAGFNASDLVPHEVGGLLKKGTLGDLATFIGGQISATSGVGFRAVQVLDGQTLPATTEQEFILVGPGTFPNVGGGASITTTEELNALVSNGTYWFIGVEIPINAAEGAFEPAIATGTTAQYWRGDKTWQDLNKAAVGLSNVDNTTDAGKPISTATQTALDLKANDNAVVKLTGNQSISGSKIFNDNTIFEQDILIKQNDPIISMTGYTTIAAITNGLKIHDGGVRKALFSLANTSTLREYQLPDANGTFALISNLHDPITIDGPNPNGLTLLGQKIGITFASSTLNGALSFSDWNTFNNKIGGSGTTNYLPKFTGASALGNSLIYDNGTNVGIGTTSPNSYGAGYVGLTLDGSTTSFITARANGVNKITLSANGGGGTPVLQANDATTDFGFQVGGSERMRITSTGNVGIGTTSPAAKLEVAGRIATTGGSSNDVLSQYVTLKDITSTNDYVLRYQNSSGSQIGYIGIISSANRFTYQNGNGHIFLGGNVLIGTTTDSGYKLDVNGNVKATSFIKSGGTSSQFLMADGSISTGTAAYKVYTALLTQTGTNAPTATVLENTLGGTVVWTRSGVGAYIGTLSNAFTSEKTAVFCTKDTGSPTGTGGVMMRGYSSSTSNVLITVVTSSGGIDGQIANSSVEIRVYN